VCFNLIWKVGLSTTLKWWTTLLFHIHEAKGSSQPKDSGEVLYFRYHFEFVVYYLIIPESLNHKQAGIINFFSEFLFREQWSRLRVEHKPEFIVCLHVLRNAGPNENRQSSRHYTALGKFYPSFTPPPPFREISRHCSLSFIIIKQRLNITRYVYYPYWDYKLYWNRSGFLVWLFNNAETCIFSHSSTSLVVLSFFIFEVSRSHSDTPHLVGLLWTSDGPVAEISDHIQHSQEETFRLWRDSNSES
jgi:hypothetical protein